MTRFSQKNRFFMPRPSVSPGVRTILHRHLLSRLSPALAIGLVMAVSGWHVECHAQGRTELAGLGVGEFDQMFVTGDLNLAGDLFVDLIDGFQFAYGDEFLIADIGGELFGQFNGLGEGDLVGNFGGRNLFISYSAGNGNDVSLFSAIPDQVRQASWRWQARVC